MWVKYLISIIAFYFLAVFQNSFFTSFNQLGITPNLIIILFFLLIFFEKEKEVYPIIIYAVSAGFFLDIFSSEFFGVSIALLTVGGIAIKKIHAILSEKNNKYSFVYFLSLYIVFLIFYGVFWTVYFYVFHQQGNFIDFNVKGAVNIVFNLIFASATFVPYQKIVENMADRRQLLLFKDR